MSDIGKQNESALEQYKNINDLEQEFRLSLKIV